MTTVTHKEQRERWEKEHQTLNVLRK
jgi:hypothetical protein